MERYDVLRDIGSGNFGVAKLVMDRWSGELFAVKFIERGLKRITIPEIKRHPWFQKNLPIEFMEDGKGLEVAGDTGRYESAQSTEETLAIIEEARKGNGGELVGGGGSMDFDDIDVESSGDFVYANLINLISCVSVNSHKMDVKKSRKSYTRF